VRETALSGALIGKGNYRHFMQKEIFEQPAVIGDTLQVLINPARRSTCPSCPLPSAISAGSPCLPAAPRTIQASLPNTGSKPWPASRSSDIASEFRYRAPAMPRDGAAIIISQSGETPDTLAALRYCPIAARPGRRPSLSSTSRKARSHGGRRGPPTLAGPEMLQLKEISYIHAEGYAAGEMKHGPIALIDDNVPVVVVAPPDGLFDKTLSNVEEVIARDARVVMISDAAGIARLEGRCAFGVAVPQCAAFVAPLLYAIPVQLLAYHTAVLKGTGVDQPRNLAKSVTVSSSYVACRPS
jgi:glucosamine 6-phosphate synthetase-like amidotransferase/phosphosugar isomerase protein